MQYWLWQYIWFDLPILSCVWYLSRCRKYWRRLQNAFKLCPTYKCVSTIRFHLHMPIYNSIPPTYAYIQFYSTYICVYTILSHLHMRIYNFIPHTYAYIQLCSLWQDNLPQARCITIVEYFNLIFNFLTIMHKSINRSMFYSPC